MLPPLIREEDLDLSRTDFGFAKLAGESLGNAATDEDGTAELLAEAGRGFEQGGNLVASLDDELGKHFAPVVGATDNPLAAEGNTLAAGIAKGEKLTGEGPVLVDDANKNPVQTLPITPPPQPGAPGTILAYLNRPGHGGA